MAQQMTNDQRTFARHKLNQLVSKKKQELIKKYDKKLPKTFPRSKLSAEEMFEALKKDKVKLRKKFRRKATYEHNLTDVTNFFDFSSAVDKDGYVDREAFIRDHPDFKAEREKLSAAANRVEAEIMLGTGSEALQLLREFENQA